MKQRNVLLVIQPAYPERISGIARFARSHGWHLTIVDRLARRLLHQRLPLRNRPHAESVAARTLTA